MCAGAGRRLELRADAGGVAEGTDGATFHTEAVALHQGHPQVDRSP